MMDKMYRWLSQALEDSEQTSLKMHQLLSGLNINKELWEEITEHMADTTCLLRNALNEIPKPEKPIEPDWKELLMQEKQSYERVIQTWDTFRYDG